MDVRLDETGENKAPAAIAYLEGGPPLLSVVASFRRLSNRGDPPISDGDITPLDPPCTRPVVQQDVAAREDELGRSPGLGEVQVVIRGWALVLSSGRSK
jgi:hypothetical protein